MDTNAFLHDLPLLHDRPPQPAHSGGLNPTLGRVFVELLTEKQRIVETGAGNSTILFCALGCAAVTSIAPDPDLEGRIRAAAAERDVDTSTLTFHCARSEATLPRLTLVDEQECEAAFIDGNHGWPSVMVDFCYLNRMLLEGGLLFIDDVHIYSCEQLVLLLRSQPGWECLSVVGKMATFRKTNGRRWLPDSSREPFIIANTMRGRH